MKIRELSVRLLCPFPRFCQPASYDAPIPTVSLPSLPSALIHLVFSTCNAVSQDSFATFSMTGPISLSLAFGVFSATTGRLMDASSEFTWLGPIPACNIPISGQQFCRLQETFTQFKTGYIFHCYSPAASFVFMSNTGLPRVPAFARCILLVWHTFISPQVSSPQVMYKKLPKPEIVSCVQSARRSGFPHDLQPPSSSFANKSSSTTRLPVTGYSHFDKETLSTIYHFRSAFFYFLSTNFHLFV